MASRRTRRAGSKRRSTRKGTKWTSFVKKIHMELKRKNPDSKLGDAMKAASKRKHEM